MVRTKTLLHVHTDYSYDSNISLDALANYVAEHGFGCVAVTDHDTIEGALRFRNRTPARVIVGEEISTRDGHLIGLFLKTHVRAGDSALDTAKAIREQGGLVLVPHPFVKAFGCGIRDHTRTIIDLIDAVEINNAQNLLRRPDREAENFAKEFGKTPYVGADSHMASSIAPCYQIMRDFGDAADFLRALDTAELKTGRHPLTFFASTGFRLVCGLAGLTLPGEFGANASPAQSRVVPTPSVAAV